MSAAADALPERSILLHVGPHKTGTTSIQAKLASARADLAERGITYPGPRGAHHAEARALIGRPEGFAGDTKPLAVKAWQRLVRIAGEAAGTVVLSSEFFALSTAEDRARLAAQLDVDRLHVVLAARNPGLLALSAWQQSVSSGNTTPLADWLEERFRRDRPGAGGSDFWGWADAATLVAGWSEVVAPERIHVVVVDEGDRGLIPATFEQLLGLPAGLVADQPTQAHNRSLTSPEVELVRATSALVKDELSWAEYSLFFRQGLGRQLIYGRTPAADEARTGLPSWAADQAAAEAEDVIGRLQASGARIVGDLENLRSAPRPATATVPGAVPGAGPAEVPLEVAANAAAGVVLAARDRLRRAEERIAELEGRRGLHETPVPELAKHLTRRVAGRAKRALRPGR